LLQQHTHVRPSPQDYACSVQQFHCFAQGAAVLAAGAVLQGVDVCSQAFSMFDPAKSGAADMATLKRFLKQLHNVEVGAQLHAEPALIGCGSLSRW
jgi:hypothetical protein